MNPLIDKTTATFSGPFTLPGFDETLPAGDYEIETELCPHPDHLNPEAWKASVLIHLRPRVSHPVPAARSGRLSADDTTVPITGQRRGGGLILLDSGMHC